VDDVMAEMHFGPNGALIFCMEYLIDNIEWLTEHLEGYLEDDYLLIDCPGQIELYSHIPVFRR
jgi:GTPase SAR1 family protein